MAVSPAPDRRRDALVPVLLALLGVAATVLVLRELRPATPLHDAQSERRTVAQPVALGSDEERTIEIFRAVSPSVVHVAARDGERRFRLDPARIEADTGSGFVWNDEGYVVTNEHLVARGEAWEVTLADYTTYPARLVGAAREYDLAVLKIDAPPAALQPIPLGTSFDLRVGQYVLAIGNPFGLDRTLTTGVISGLGRRVTTDLGVEIHNVIQTDAAINPGNSGGPLLDSSGRLIGVNTAIVSDHFGSSGVGLAVPVDVVNTVVPYLIRGGRGVPRGRRPSLGLSVMPESFSAAHGVDGAVIEEVWPGSGADLAGLRPLRKADDGTFTMDVIVEVDGNRVRNGFDLAEALEMRAPMDVVEVGVLRDDERLSFPVELTELR